MRGFFCLQAILESEEFYESPSFLKDTVYTLNCWRFSWDDQKERDFAKNCQQIQDNYNIL